MEQGSLVRDPISSKNYFVSLVNPSRAFLIPLSGVPHSFTDDAGDTVCVMERGRGINVSPNAAMEEVSVEDLNEREFETYSNLKEVRDMEAAVSDAPVGVGPATKTNKEKNRARLDALKARKAAEKVSKPRVPKAPKAPKSLKPCACGCGEEVSAYFAQGHDARFKGWLLKIEKGKMKVEELPAVVRKAYTWKKKGEGMIPTLNYKGEKHTGYIA